MTQQALVTGGGGFLGGQGGRGEEGGEERDEALGERGRGHERERRAESGMRIGEWRVVEGVLLHAWDRRDTLFGVGS
jgi:hypothetical protein